VERRLAVMAGAGVLPGQAAAEAARQGWRVVALTFDHAAGLDGHVERIVPSSLTDIQAVLRTLTDEGVQAALFVGKFWKQRVFDKMGEADDAGLRLARGGLSDEALASMVVTTLAGMGIEVLDQRTFLSSWMMEAGTLTSRAPTAAEWEEIHAGFSLARQIAGFGIGQTVVRSRGVTLAVEAAEGTDETIRRGARLGGPGAVVVKAVAAEHDFRFDIPTVGATTLEAMVECGATALAVDGGKMLLVDRDEAVRAAEQAGIALVGLHATG
jgi:UDP-2,3-diacylglucosamine hydrolase